MDCCTTLSQRYAILKSSVENYGAVRGLKLERGREPNKEEDVKTEADEMSTDT